MMNGLLRTTDWHRTKYKRISLNWIHVLTFVIFRKIRLPLGNIDFSFVSVKIMHY